MRSQLKHAILYVAQVIFINHHFHYIDKLANQKDGCSHFKEETFNEFWPHVVQRKQYQEMNKKVSAYKVQFSCIVNSITLIRFHYKNLKEIKTGSLKFCKLDLSITKLLFQHVDADITFRKIVMPFLVEYFIQTKICIFTSQLKFSTISNKSSSV